MANTFSAYYHSPLGPIRISGTESFISEVSFRPSGEEMISSDNIPPLLINCMEQLIQYFAGQRRVFELPLSQEGTAFQQQVWNLLMGIPFGKTISYLQLAIQAGDPKSTRAVANANSKNDIAVIVPCHRVIGIKGELTGYAGGLPRKRWLLEHERKIAFGIQTLF